MIDTTNLFDGTYTAAGVFSGSAITASRASINVLDLLASVDMGVGTPLQVRLTVTQAFATCTSLQIDLQVSSAAAGTYYTIESSPVYPVAQLIVNAPIFEYVLPRNQLLNGTAGVKNLPGRYMRLNYTVAGSNATSGAVVAWLAPRQDRPSSVGIYAANYTAAVSSGEI